MTCNIQPSTLFTGDNLDILQGINSESIDLVYLDPPFNKNNDFKSPIGGAAFRDKWDADDIDYAAIELLREKQPRMANLWDAMPNNGTKGYMGTMIPRLIEIHRILKSSGSMLLHCDETMTGWLRVFCDVLFKETNFRNEIIWKRTGAKNNAKKFGRIHDTILFYNKNKSSFEWQGTRQPLDEEYVENNYIHDDKDGRGVYARNPLCAPSNGETGPAWRGVSPGHGRSWSPNRTFPGAENLPNAPIEAIEQMYQDGRIHWS